MHSDCNLASGTERISGQIQVNWSVRQKASGNKEKRKTEEQKRKWEGKSAMELSP